MASHARCAASDSIGHHIISAAIAPITNKIAAITIKIGEAINPIATANILATPEAIAVIVVQIVIAAVTILIITTIAPIAKATMPRIFANV